MASYDILTYLDSKTKKQQHLVVPQRSGSSFVKDIINNIPASQRSNLTVTGEGVPIKTISSLREADKPGFFEINQGHLSFSPTVNIKVVYRHPIARYASALPMLLGDKMDHFQIWLSTKADLSDPRDRTIAEGYCDYMDIPYSAVMGPPNKNVEVKPLQEYALEHLMDTVMEAHQVQDIDIWWEPTFSESHLRPVMLQTAVLACMSEKPEFIELEDLTDWATSEIINGYDMSTIGKEEMIVDWHNGRAHLPKGNSAVASRFGQYCLDYLRNNYPEMFALEYSERETLPLHFEQYMAPDVETYKFIARTGKFENREELVDFLVTKVFKRYPYAITRSPYAIRWFSNNVTLGKLPPRLAKAIRDNIKSGLQYINDRSYFHLADYLRDQF